MNGLPTTASSAEWARLFPEPVRRDALEVARLRAAGAVVLGKTAADDFAYRGNGTSSHTGQVRNPLRSHRHEHAGRLERRLGGRGRRRHGVRRARHRRRRLESHSGAVCTGIVGMKPTFGLVPRTGVIPTWPYLDTHGPLARTVADAALLLAAIAGADRVGSASRCTARGRTAPLAALRDDALEGRARSASSTRTCRARKMTRGSAGGVGSRGGRPARRGRDRRAVRSRRSRAPPTATRSPSGEGARRRRRRMRDRRRRRRTRCYRYFAGRTDDPRDGDAARLQRLPIVLRRAAGDVRRMRAAARAADRARPGGAVVRALARRRRGSARAIDARGRRRGDGLSDDAVQRARAADAWPDIRTALGYGNWLGLPEVSVPAGLGADGMPALNLSVAGLPGDDARVLALAHAYERQSRRFVPPPSPKSSGR